jgi:hypothetical protein
MLIWRKSSKEFEPQICICIENASSGNPGQSVGTKFYFEPYENWSLELPTVNSTFFASRFTIIYSSWDQVY